jgi:hypothetical protein
VATVTLPLEDRRRLARALSHDSLPCPARGLEFVLYSQEDLKSPQGPAFQLNLNTGARLTPHVGLDPADDPRFWFIVDVSIAREHAEGLAGAPASRLLPRLPRALVLAALRDAVAWYGNHDATGAETALTACRAWAWATDGKWRSKREGAEWARPRVREPTAIDRAMAMRNGAGAPPLTGAELRTVLAPAQASITAALSTSGP